MVPEEGAMKMKRRVVIAALAMGTSFSVLADDQPPGKSQQLYLPRLGDIMVVTQLRHFKLWYAGQVRNWELANYELAQIRASFEDAKEALSKYPCSGCDDDNTVGGRGRYRDCRKGQREISEGL